MALTMNPDTYDALPEYRIPSLPSRHTVSATDADGHRVGTSDEPFIVTTLRAAGHPESTIRHILTDATSWLLDRSRFTHSTADEPVYEQHRRRRLHNAILTALWDDPTSEPPNSQGSDGWRAQNDKAYYAFCKHCDEVVWTHDHQRVCYSADTDAHLDDGSHYKVDIDVTYTTRAQPYEAATQNWGTLNTHPSRLTPDAYHDLHNPIRLLPEPSPEPEGEDDESLVDAAALA